MKNVRKHRLPLLFTLTALFMVLCPVLVLAAEEGADVVLPSRYATGWALVPPVIAIALALITKEVYSSLFIGIVVGGLLYSNFSFEGTINQGLLYRQMPRAI